MGVERKIETAAEWNRQAVVEPEINSPRFAPDARVEDIVLLIIASVRRRLPLMVRGGFYGQLSIVVQFQDGVPQGLKVADEEMTKIRKPQ